VRITWIQPEDLLPHELVASRLAGRDISDVARRWTRAGGSATPPAKGASPRPADPVLRALATQLLDALDGQPDPRGPDEPVALEDIEAGWPQQWNLPGPPQHTELTDRVHGAWLGRAAGCLLGKPVEGLPREGIEELLRSNGRWPLGGYFSAKDVPVEVARRWPWNRRSRGTSLAENIDGMPEDDDLNFPLLALLLLERHGTALSSADVATGWLDFLPAARVFTAERVAYRNLLLGHVPPQTATIRNPFREWIGAQIRTDLYGWVNPGDPAAAARLAYRDATVSHVRNGVYGALYVAAMGAAAVAGADLDTILDTGYAVLPARSQIATAVSAARDLVTGQSDWSMVLDELHQQHGHLHWVHVVNNAALTTAALAHGNGDFARSVCAVVTGGWDTDSNGATVGGVLGAMTGADSLPGAWVDPLAGRLASSLPGQDGVRFADLARRTVQVAGGGA
jgi:ADP-ribosylglycohydrolase